jgi:PAS domain S-box-containing protein
VVLVNEKLARLSPDNPVVEIENRVIVADGSIRWMHFINRAIYDKEDQLLEIQAVGRDISDRKILEDALVTSEKEFRLLAEAMPQIVWITEADGRNTFFNQQWIEYTGLSQEESYGDGWNKPFHPDDQQRAWDAWQNAINHNATYSLECRLRRADGKYRWWLIRGVPVNDETGTISKWFGTCTDIHDIKQIESDLRIATLTEQEIVARNTELTHQVLSRNAELSELTAHIQNIAETERANLANELHDEMGSTLVGIKMGLTRLGERITAPDLLQDLSSIKDLVSHATEIKKKIISRLYPTILDDCGFVGAVQQLVAEYKKTSAMEIELVIHGDPIDMEHAYSLAAYRITQECLTNIAKHAEASKVKIEAIAKDRFLDLTILDNGRGFPVENETSGHGIFGMTERAKYLGGAIEFHSENGKGTTVHLRLPLSASKPINKKRVLVVDDHAIVRDAIKHLLEPETDFSVEGEAADGEAAVKKAIDEEWDIVLLDITMPKKNGIKVLEEVLAAKPDLPVIMLSGHAKDEYAEVALAKGAFCYLEKGETDRLVEEMRKATISKDSR